MAQIAGPNETVIHFQFQIRMREIVSKMHLAIPTVIMEPIIHIFDQEEYSRKKIVQGETLLHLVRNIPVAVTICTTETPFPIRSLLSLQLGDTLVLNQWQESPVIIKVEGRNKLLAKASMDKARKAFAITGCVQTRMEEPLNGPIAK
jgi:flagellar motor switch protein FliM